MSDQTLRIEPQYLQAASQYASQLNVLIWQKMALIFAVQSAVILAAYAIGGIVAFFADPLISG